jgi:hypothetical protein
LNQACLRVLPAVILDEIIGIAWQGR